MNKHHPKEEILMHRLALPIPVGISMALGACAHIDFGDEGLLYYEPVPHLLVSTAADCTTTASVLTLPGTPKRVKFVTGYGSADLSATLTNGMITEIGQNTDTKMPDTISALAELRAATAAVAMAKDLPKDQLDCRGAALYPIVNGKVVKDTPVRLLGKP